MHLLSSLQLQPTGQTERKSKLFSAFPGDFVRILCIFCDAGEGGGLMVLKAGGEEAHIK